MSKPKDVWKQYKFSGYRETTSKSDELLRGKCQGAESAVVKVGLRPKLDYVVSREVFYNMLGPNHNHC